MALNLSDRVRDTTTTIGTGTVTLSGTAPTGYQTFETGVGNGNTTYYTINAGNNWEVGIGTYSSTGPTLTRDTVLASSASGAKVDFPAGTKDVFVTYPAEKAIADGYGLLPVSNGGTGTATQFTAGSVVFAGTSGVYTQDNANLFWDDTNNRLGIGTTLPAAKLDIQGGSVRSVISTITSAGSPLGSQIYLGDNNFGSTFALQGPGIGSVFNSTTNVAGDLALYTYSGSARTERARIDASGNVGIGTGSPIAKLDVQGAGGSVAFQVKRDATNVFQIYQGGGINYFDTAASGQYSFSVNGSERMRLDASGNLGLGVVPSAWNRAAIEVGVAGAAVTRDTRDLILTSNAYIDAGGWKYAVSSVGAGLYANAVGAHKWFTAPSGTAGNAISFTQAMTLDANGNLGIGTTTPASKLDVNGQITVPDQLAYDYTTSVLPTVAPALNLNFVQSGVVDPRITFTRSSTATFVGSNGLIQTAAVNTPRLDYDPVTLAPKGLLIEEQRTNLVTYSEQFDNANWTKDLSSVTTNATVSPDGTSNADLWVATTSGTTSTVRTVRSISVTNGAVYTASVYAKASGRRWVFFTGPDASSSAYNCWFDLQNGVVGTKGASVTTATITAVGNGWYRLTTTSTATTTLNYMFISSTDADNSSTVTADGTSGIYIWGAQLEAGAFATSYIPTVASQVTRTADVATMTGTNFSSWYRQDEGTMVFQGSSFVPSTLASGYNALTAYDGTYDNINRVAVYSNFWFTDTRAGGAGQANLYTASSYAPNTAMKAAYAYKANDFAASFNGATALTDTSGTVPSSVNRLDIGAGFGVQLNGHIRSIQYYNTRLANTVLQGITA